MNEPKELPEATGSITFTIKIGGFPALYTVRDSASGKSLLEKLPVILEKMKAIGMEPDERGYKKFEKKEPEYVEGRVCPTCGNKLVYATKRDGSKMIKCSTNVWDAQRKMATGCPYVDWNALSNQVTTTTTSSGEEQPPDPSDDF